MTRIELRAMLKHLPRLKLESATYTALAFNDPQKLNESLQEIRDKDLSPRERWAQGIAALKGGGKR